MTQSPNPKSRREVKAMSDEELRCEIGLLLKWKFDSESPDELCHNPEGKLWSKLPNWCGDLNAMAAAEETLTEEQDRRRYEATLIRVIGQRVDATEPIEMFDFDLLHATARQRAEAFVRTLTESNAQRGEE